MISLNMNMVLWEFDNLFGNYLNPGKPTSIYVPLTFNILSLYDFFPSSRLRDIVNISEELLKLLPDIFITCSRVGFKDEGVTD